MPERLPDLSLQKNNGPPRGERPVQVALISDDRDLFCRCQEIISSLKNRQCELLAVAANGCPPAVDFYIWDSPEAVEFLRKPGQNPSRHIFLVDRKHVAKSHEDAAATGAFVLLKPVTRAALAALLEMAISTKVPAGRDGLLRRLIQTNLKLQEYDQDRTNFLARAVHDFRAPLTALCGYCGLLISGALGPLDEEQKEVLRRMHNSSRRLSRMASAMFQLCTEGQGKQPPDLRPNDIRESVEQALHEAAPLADAKQICISVDLDAGTRLLYFDPSLIERVLVNLLDNACKFTPKGGQIEIRSGSRDPNAYRIDVRNSGPPIPREHLENIFEEYTSYSARQDESGGGLGLAICRTIVTQHGGRIWATNTSRGPMFSFTLPLRHQREQDELGHQSAGEPSDPVA